MIKITLSQQQRIMSKKVSLSQGLIQPGLARSFLGCPPRNSSSTPEALPAAVPAPPTILTQTLRISCASVCTHCSLRFTPSPTLKSPASFKALLQGLPPPPLPWCRPSCLCRRERPQRTAGTGAERLSHTGSQGSGSAALFSLHTSCTQFGRGTRSLFLK